MLQTIEQNSDLINSWHPSVVLASGQQALDIVGKPAQARLTTLSFACKTLLLWH